MIVLIIETSVKDVSVLCITCSNQYFFVNFVWTTGWVIASATCGGGKSGQRRVAHHLTGGVSCKRYTESATENNRLQQ
jgi:hypothetical protein